LPIRINCCNTTPFDQNPDFSVHEDREAYFQKLAKEAHYTPDDKKTVSVRTLRRWYQTYRKQGIEGCQSPHDRYYNESRIVRAVAIESVQSYFLERELRRIDSTHSHASLAGVARSLAGH